MLAAIRAFAKSWVAAILMGLLIVSFAVWGIRDVFRGRISDSVIVAGSRVVSSAEYKKVFDQQKSRYEQQAGQPIPTEVAAANGLDRGVLEGLAGQYAYDELISKLGVRPSDKLVVSEIQKIPAFFDPVSGRFDKKSYQEMLGQNGLTVTAFEQQMRDQIAEQHFGTGLIGGLMTPRAYTAMAAVYGLETRDIAFIALTPGSVPAPPAPTDAQLTALMKELGPRLMKPEFRQISIVRFTPEVATSGPVDEAEVMKRYNFRKDTLSKPETRTVVQIPAKDAATAAQIAARLGKGENPVAVAKSLGVAAITYPDKPASAIPDAKVAAAAFKMSQGQIQTVQGNLGLAVVRVDAITPGHQVTLQEIRPAIEAEVRKEAAVAKVDQLSQAYDDAHAKGATLPEAAKKAGVPVITVGPIAKQGVDVEGKPVAGVTPKILDTAFSLPPGGDSELVEAGNGEYFAVHVDKVIPPAMRTLEEIRPQLVKFWTQREVGNRLQAKADELLARVKKGESLEAVASSAGAKVTRLPGLTRQTAGQNQQLGQEVLAQTFIGKPGDAFTAHDNTGGVVVGKIEAIRTGDVTNMAHAVEANRPQMTEAYLREIVESARAAARTKIKVRTDLDRARAALGLEPASAAKPAAGKPGLAK
jgi:peptidyl-prolyl cis-trans isomerase D